MQTRLALDRDAAHQHGLGGIQFVCIQVERGGPGQRVRHQFGGVQRLQQRQRGADMPVGQVDLAAFIHGRYLRDVHTAGQQGPGLDTWVGQQCGALLFGFKMVAAQAHVAAVLDDQLKRQRQVVFGGPGQCSAQVVVVGIVQRAALQKPRLHGRPLRRRRFAQKVLGMALLQPLRLATGVEVAPCIQAQRFVQRVARRGAGLQHGGDGAQQRMVDQRVQRIEHGPLVELVVAEHRLHGLQAEAAGKNGQPAQHGLFDRRQQVVAPVQRSQQRQGLAAGVEFAAHQQAQAFVQAVVQAGHTQHRHTRRRQADGQRYAVQLATDAHHGLDVGRGQLKARVGTLRTRHEPGHGTAAAGLGQARAALYRQRRQRQGRQPQHLLAGTA